MKKGYQGLLVSVGLGLLIPFIIWLLVRLTPVPPEEAMKTAREALSKAGHDKADTYSKRLYSEAKTAYDSAIFYWKKENNRFIYFRKYQKVGTFAKLSTKKALQATENSQTNSSSLKVKLQDKIESVNRTASNIEKLFNRYPMSSEIRTRISKGNQLLKEGEDVYNKGQYLPANAKITEAEYLLSGVYESTISELKDYFRSYTTWKRWTQSAIIESKTSKSYSIIVDKFSRKCYVYLSGEKKYEFDTELGRNWVGNKRRMGDKATPEGVYKIVNKFQGNQTEYYKSLSLDYPNARDKERFRAEVKKGTLPGWAKIGNGIEIHGGGGKGVDWTEGCIALTDSEIDMVFSIAKVGTPVTIVGSLKDINQILDN
jgi:L,D-peptidoglycan transpeptidase YkuD (ErfK/YbiS/YcfS/YnhG family)